MCLLTYISPFVQPDAQALRNGAVVNNDGHGWALIADGRVLSGHSMDFEEALSVFLTMRVSYPDGPAMFHSRYTTHGKTDLTNCHPYRALKLGDTVVGHNGILPISAQPVKGESRSDTRIFAEDILWHRYPALDSQRTRRRLESWLGPGNKLVILTTDAQFKANAYIFNENQGTWVDGIWYSNSGYLPYTYSVVGRHWWRDDYEWPTAVGGTSGLVTNAGRISDAQAYEHWWEDELAGRNAQGGIYYTHGVEGYQAIDVDECPGCRSTQLDPALRLCLACHACLDCCQSVTGCQCWDPEEVETVERVAAVAARETAVREDGGSIGG